MVSTERRYHNAFLRIYQSVVVMESNKFSNCSAVEFVRCVAPKIKENRFYDSVDTGLAIFHTRKAFIKGNIFKNSRKFITMLKLNKADLCRIISNRFLGDGVGVMFYGKSCENQVLANSFFDNRYAVDFRSQNSNDNLILSCSFMDSISSSILFRGGKNNSVRNCVIWNPKSTGVLIANFRKATGRKYKINLSFINNVFCGGKVGVFNRMDDAKVKVECNVFWDNKINFKGLPEDDLQKENIFTDPLFVNPDEGNFRLKQKAFGYENDSPLRGAGFSERTNIGLFP
jgi:hypothetical protein